MNRPATINDIIDLSWRGRREPALLRISEGGKIQAWTFDDVAEVSYRAMGALESAGVERDSRVLVMGGQSAGLAAAYLAIWAIGAQAVPVSTLIGETALAARIEAVDPAALVVDEDLTPTPRPSCPILVVNANDPFADAPPTRGTSTGNVRGDHAATIIFTSGSTGPPKGAVLGHRTLMGRLPGFRLAHNVANSPKSPGLYWSPIEWIWVGSLFDSLLCPWACGMPVLMYPRGKFDPEYAAAYVARAGAKHAFLPPTALRMMVEANPRLSLSFDGIHSGGEHLDEDLLARASAAFGTTVNEIYGQTEASFLVGNSSWNYAVRAGSMGRAYPPHVLTLLGEDGNEVEPGEIGELAVAGDDPVLFSGYLGENGPVLDERGRWRTGDLAHRDDDGYLYYAGRRDNLIISSGYRIGPHEVERAIAGVEGVKRVVVVARPDPVRGSIVAAVIEPDGPRRATRRFEDAIRSAVRREVAAYAYPRYIHFVDEIPLTVTGKIDRAAAAAIAEEMK